MGAAASIDSADTSKLAGAVNLIAAKFIFSEKFQSIKNLTSLDTCNELVVMTSDLVDKYLSVAQVQYLAQHLEVGAVVDKTGNEELLFFPKAAAQGPTPAMGVPPGTKKTRMCMGIAQFYVRVFNIFAAIVTTVNPEYTYRDPRTGRMKTVGLLERGAIPKGVDARKTTSGSLCAERINALYSPGAASSTTGPGTITVKPDICSLNKSSDGSDVTLIGEPGMSELRSLYNDKYNFTNGKFDGMTLPAETRYRADVATMYKAFTGETAVPPGVTSFSHIPLKQYWRTPLCDAPKPTFARPQGTGLAPLGTPTRLPGTSFGPRPQPSYGQGAVPPRPSSGQGAPARPSYGQGAPPQPSSGQGAVPPRPSYGQGAVPPRPSYGQGAVPPRPSYGQGAPPQPSSGQGAPPQPSSGQGAPPQPSSGQGAPPAQPSSGQGAVAQAQSLLAQAQQIPGQAEHLLAQARAQAQQIPGQAEHLMAQTPALATEAESALAAMVGGATNPAAGAFSRTYVGSAKDAVFAQYAQHIALMMQTAEKKHDALLALLLSPKGQAEAGKSLFKVEVANGTTTVTVRPGLTMASLNAIAQKAEQGIVDLYATCETQFQQGVRLLEAVVAHQYQETTQMRESELDKQLDIARAMSIGST
jgi:rubredoxin